MKLRNQSNLIDMQTCREAWRLCELGCNGSPQVQAVMLYAVATAIHRPIETMPCPNLDSLWMAFKALVQAGKVKLPELPLPLLSNGERFALAVGTLFNTDHLPTGETFLEIVDSVAGVGIEQASIYALSAILSLATVQAMLPADLLEFHGVKSTRDYDDDELEATAREALDAIA